MVGAEQFTNNVMVQDGVLTLNGGEAIVHFAKNPTDGFLNPAMYERTNLFGMELSYDIDVSNVPCRCAAGV